MLDADMALANRKAYEQKMVQFIAGALVRCLFARNEPCARSVGRVRSGLVVRRRLCVVPLCAENMAQRVAGAPVQVDRCRWSVKGLLHGLSRTLYRVGCRLRRMPVSPTLYVVLRRTACREHRSAASVLCSWVL